MRAHTHTGKLEKNYKVFTQPEKKINFNKSFRCYDTLIHFDPCKQCSVHLSTPTSPLGPMQAMSHEMLLLFMRPSRPILRLSLSYCRYTHYFRFSVTKNQRHPSTSHSIPPSFSLTIAVLQLLYMWQGLSFSHPVTLPFVLSNMSATRKPAQAS